MRNIEIFELISINIFIELSQWCVRFEDIVTFIANMIRFDLQYFIIVLWYTIYKDVRVKGTSTSLIPPIMMISNLWHFLRRRIKFSYSIRIELNCINITHNQYPYIFHILINRHQSQMSCWLRYLFSIIYNVDTEQRKYYHPSPRHHPPI